MEVVLTPAGGSILTPCGGGKVVRVIAADKILADFIAAEWGQIVISQHFFMRCSYFLCKQLGRFINLLNICCSQVLFAMM